MTPAPPAAPLGLPTHLRLLGPLGAGGAATVWRARDTRHGRDVAVKLLEGPVPADALEQEARALARCRDVPGVVAVLGCGVTVEGGAWLVTELVAHGSLAERLETGSAPPAHELAARLATTLAEVHRRGVVHGDVTPANVLLAGDGTPLLADFGLAPLDGAAGRRGCTPAYAAPERLRGAPPSPAADVYSMAATVRAAAAGELMPALEACLAERPSRRPDAASVAAALRPRPGRWRRR